MTNLLTILFIIYILASICFIFFLYEKMDYYKNMFKLEKEDFARYRDLYKIEHFQKVHLKYINKNLQEQLNQKDKPDEKHYGC